MAFNYQSDVIVKPFSYESHKCGRCQVIMWNGLKTNCGHIYCPQCAYRLAHTTAKCLCNRNIDLFLDLLFHEPVWRPPTQVFDEENCSICSGLIVNRSVPTCGHVFCFNCLKTWGQYNLACPLCKQTMTFFGHSQNSETGQYQMERVRNQRPINGTHPYFILKRMVGSSDPGPEIMQKMYNQIADERPVAFCTRGRCRRELREHNANQTR